MQENYSEDFKLETQEEQVERGPKISTINFIKQFARAFTATGIMNPAIDGFIAN